MFERRFVFSVFVLLGFVSLAASIPPLAHADASDDFVITVKSDNPGSSNSTQFTIPTTGSGYNYNVDCNNDDTLEATAQTGDYTCTYGTAGTYTIRIKDNSGAKTGFPRIYFTYDGDGQKLLTIEQWGKGKWTSMYLAFAGCYNMNLVARDSPDLSNVTSLRGMFSYATAFNGNIGSWNTANVTDMAGMFSFATAFNQNISNWNTSNVTNMSTMFLAASSFNQNLGGWDINALTDADQMFYGVELSTVNYDALLNGWNAQIVHSGVMFGGGNSEYCAGEAARSHMISADSWNITDGGKNCPPADLRIVKKVKKVSATKHKYTLKVQDLGANPGEALVVTDKLPKHYTISKVSSLIASCETNGRTATCTLAQLNHGATLTITIVASPNGATGINCAAVKASTTDPNPANNKSCVQVPH